MILSNFMRKNVKRKAKAGVPPPPRQSLTSLAYPVSSDEVFDINENAVESRVTQDSNLDMSIDRQSPSSSRTRSPLVQLDYIPEPLENWFPQELLDGTAAVQNSRLGLGVSSAPGSRATSDEKKEGYNQAVPYQRRNANASHSRQPSGLLAPGALKKSIPAPIFIPDIEGVPTTSSIGQPAVTVAAAAPPNLDAPARTFPPSPISDENMSAISGTTIARALIGNSFVLSSSDRGSKYRSGITRQDSATLPRGDNPLFNSPYSHDRRISGGETVDLTRESPIPPVPPLPLNAGAPLLDQATSSTATDKSQAPSDASASPPEHLPAEAQYVSPDMIMHSGLSRRISRISEVSSPAPTTPMFPQSVRNAQPMKSGSSLAASVFTRMDEVDSDFPTTASHTPATTSSSQSCHRTRINVSTTSVQSSGLPSSSPTDNGLDEYTFVPPQHIQSATTSGSDSSIFVGRLKSKYSDISLKRRKTRVLGVTSSSTGRRSFKASGVLSDRTGIFQRNKKQIRLPIGDRPGSIIVPQTPITPALIASATVQHRSTLSQFPLVPSSAVPIGHLELPISALADVDVLSTTPLSGAGVFAARQCIFGVPGPATVIQDYDLLDYAISVTPDSQNSLNSTSSSSSAVEQTFPETPNIFTPLFTPAYPVSERVLLLPPERREWHRSTTLPIPDAFVLSQMKMLDVQPRGEDTTKEDTFLGFCRPASADLPMASVPAPEHLHSEISPDVVSVSLSNVVGQKTHTIDQETDAAVASSPSPVDPVDPSVSSLYHLSASSDKLQYEDALKSLAPHSASSISSITTNAFTSSPSQPSSSFEQPRSSPALVPLPESQNASPHLLFTRSGSILSMTNLPGTNLQSLSPKLQTPSSTKCQIGPSTQSPNLGSQVISPRPQAVFSTPNPLLQRPESSTHIAGTSFLPSVSPPPPSTPPRSPPPPSPTASSMFTPSFVAPPPYHAVITSKNNSPSAASASDSPSRAGSVSRQTSISATQRPPNTRNRARSRPPLPIGPRKPGGPSQPLGSFVPGIRDRNESVSSVGSGYGTIYSWHKLSAAASAPPPKFQAPPPKWRGMTMEAARWTLKQHELQTIASRAIKQSGEASSIRLLRSEALDVDIPEEVHRLEMRRTDVKSKYKMLVRKRWQLMGTLAGHLDEPNLGDHATAVHIVEELSEVSLTLDQLADELHNIVEQLGQLKSLRDVHSTSALAMTLRKINTSILNQVAESNKLREQIQAMEAERDEAWKQAELVAQDFDNLTDQVHENPKGRGQEGAASRPLSRRSTQVSAVRKSSIRQSKAGLRSVSRCRSRRSSVSSSGARASLVMSASATTDDIPPVPPLPLHRPLGIVTSDLSRRNSLVSGTSFSDARALQQAQKELYDMLGLTLQETPSEASPVSGMPGSKRHALGPRPMSDIVMSRPHTQQNRAIHSVLYDDVRLSTRA